MKHLIITLSILLFCKCSHSQDSNIQIIDSFVKNVVLSESFNFENVSKYVNLNETSLGVNRDDASKILEMNLDDIKLNIFACKNFYQITKHSNVDTELSRNYNLSYVNYDEVYYLLCDDKIITPIIVQHGKIVSFFIRLKKAKSQQAIPWLLN